MGCVLLAESANASAAPSKQHLEETQVSQSLHPEKVDQPQPVPAPQHATPAAQHDPQYPTSVAEDEVDTVIAHVKEADRYNPVMTVYICLSFVKSAAGIWAQHSRRGFEHALITSTDLAACSLAKNDKDAQVADCTNTVAGKGKIHTDPA